MGLIYSPETPVSSCQPTLRNNAEERRLYRQRGRSLKFRDPQFIIKVNAKLIEEGLQCFGNDVSAANGWILVIR